MKKLIILTFFLYGCYSLNTIDKTKNKEVVFILFEDSSSTKKDIRKKIIKGEIQKGYNYEYFFSKDSPFFWLSYSNYHDFDDAISQINKSIIFEVDKSFLKKNKEIILTKEILDKIGGQESFKLLLGAETIFLIDKAEVKNNKILIREVKLDWENIE
uniref:Lipoprotein n=1 Tax=Tenacibaculum sp. Pbs-1 TaxID=3238748 RepID=A0AB33KV34_9FLAO